MIIMMVDGKLPTISFQTVAGNSSGASSYTFTSQPIGTASSSRYVIVSAIVPSLSAISLSCTIGGSAATAVSGASGSASSIYWNMWRRLVTSGTTANIVITPSASASSCHIGVWSIYDTRDAGAPFGATSNSTAGTSLSLNVNTAANGVGCGLVLDAANVTWSGATEDYDALIAGKWMTAASFTGAAAATPRSVSVTCSATGLYGNFASFR